MKLIKDRFEEQAQIEKLQKEKSIAELNFLKAQIHPHFLFNTLNNLYLLALEKSDETPGLILKLSDILDYMLYHCNDPRVRLSKEIELIEDYIDLEKLRYGKRLDLTFNIDIDKENYEIAPLILISLVENAFKHGTSSHAGDAFIHISLQARKGLLSCEVINSKAIKNQNIKSKSFRNGIGVKNMERQLDLTYPDSYQILRSEEGDRYMTSLKITL